MLGWSVQGELPDVPKMLIIGAPHTSYMDGVIGFAVLMALGLRATTMVKHTAFKGPLGLALRCCGAIPIDRDRPNSMPAQAIAAFKGNTQMIMLIAPEGTRHGANEWKRGFYRIAQRAEVPIVPAICNYKHKFIRFEAPVKTNGDYEAQLSALLNLYGEFGAPLHPLRLSRPMREALRRKEGIDQR